MTPEARGSTLGNTFECYLILSTDLFHFFLFLPLCCCHRWIHKRFLTRVQPEPSHHSHSEPRLRGKSFSSCLTVTFAPAAARCSAESGWASWGQCKQGALQSGGLGSRGAAAAGWPGFSNWHFPSCPHSLHQYSQPEREGGRWGEEQSKGEKEDNTVKEYSGALSLAGSFNSLSAFPIHSLLLSPG